MMHLPPVARVGAIAVQNSSAILGLTNANSSRYSNEILMPRPESGVVVVALILDPLSNLMSCTLYVATPALM